MYFKVIQQNKVVTFWDSVYTVSKKCHWCFSL